VELDAASHDIEIHFSGGYALKTFVTDPADDEIWYVRDKAANLVAGASPRNYFVKAVGHFIRPEQK
jgi:hypothetical protein